ncbi:unnamed protein product [Schistosoma bovis]|nr:unnamed protein product [Schistosoma bovis]
MHCPALFLSGKGPDLYEIELIKATNSFNHTIIKGTVLMVTALMERVYVIHVGSGKPVKNEYIEFQNSLRQYSPSKPSFLSGSMEV